MSTCDDEERDIGVLPELDSNGVEDVQPTFDNQDFIDHRQMYIGLYHRPETEKKVKRGPKLPKFTLTRPPRVFRWENGKKTAKLSDDSASEPEFFVDTLLAPASERVKFILGGEETDAVQENPHLFTELEELFVHLDGNAVWKETARWFKYEEDVEEGGDRWSKPHVATLSLYSLLELRSSLLAGTVMLDMDASTLSGVADLVIDNLISCNKLEEIFRGKVRDTLLRKHSHHRSNGFRRNLSNIISSRKNVNLSNPQSSVKLQKDIGVQYQSANGHSEVTLNVHSPESESRESPQTDSKLRLFRNYSQPAFPSPSPSPQTNVTATTPYFQHSNSVQGHLVYPAQPTVNEEHYSEKTSNFWKKLPANSEASNILVGEVDFLEKPITAFVRLSNSVIIGDLTEIPIPTKFVFIMLGPIVSPGKYHEIGRAISTLMADEIFHDVAYRAKSRDDLIAGIDEFLEQVLVLPPGEWDPSTRIDPPQNGVTKLSRRQVIENKSYGDLTGEQSGSNTASESGSFFDNDGFINDSLKRSKELFGGLKIDLKNWKERSRDIRDGLNLRCLGAVLLIYLNILAILSTVGVYLERLTGGNLGMREQLLSLFFTGLPFAVFSGQPLLVLSFTIPTVLFDGLIYKVSSNYDLDYLPFRLWIGLWASFFLLIFVALDISRCVRYLTRFSKELFIILSPLVLLGYGFVHTLKLLAEYSRLPGTFVNQTCQCVRYTINRTKFVENSTHNATIKWLDHVNADVMHVDFRECNLNGWTLTGDACQHDVIPITLLLVICAVILSMFFSSFQRFGFLPGKVNQFFHDFSSFLSVLIIALLGNQLHINIPYVLVPKTYAPDPTLRSSWLVPAFGTNTPWMAVLAIVPAVFLTLLIFVEQQVTARCINRKQNLLKKSFGYHLDLIFILFGVCLASIFGLPFTVASVFLSINHLQSTKNNADRDDYIGGFTSVSEQRITSFALYLLIALTPTMRLLLEYIPVSVMYGILLITLIRTFRNVQFVKRFTLLFIPKQKQPDVVYLRQVPLISVKIFTVVQFISLIACWALRATLGAILFPFMIFLLVLLRYFTEKILPLRDILVLDEHMPRISCCGKAKKTDILLEDIEAGIENDIHEDVLYDHNKTADRVNISEELTKTAAWKQLTYVENSNSQLSNSAKEDTVDGLNKKRRKKRTRESIRSTDGSTSPKHHRKISSSKAPSDSSRKVSVTSFKPSSDGSQKVSVTKSPEDMIIEPFDYEVPVNEKAQMSIDSHYSYSSAEPISMKTHSSREKIGSSFMEPNSLIKNSPLDRNSLKRHDSKERNEKSKRHESKDRAPKTDRVSSKKNSFKHSTSHGLKHKHTKIKQEETPPPPWDLPYHSPPRKAFHLLKIPEHDLSVDPARTWEESNDSNENLNHPSPIQSDHEVTLSAEMLDSDSRPDSPERNTKKLSPHHDSCDASGEEA